MGSATVRSAKEMKFQKNSISEKLCCEKKSLFRESSHSEKVAFLRKKVLLTIDFVK